MGEKTEDATPRRLSKARQQGQVPKSQDFSGAGTLLAGVIIIATMGPTLFNGLANNMRRVLAFQNPGGMFTDDGALRSIGESLLRGIMWGAPMSIAIFIVAYLLQLFMVGPLFTTVPLKPKISKINPLAGAKNLVKPKTLVKSAMNSVKLTCAIGVAWVVIGARMGRLASLPTMGLVPGFFAVLQTMLEVALALAILLLLIGIIDLIYQRWQHKKDLKMTKQEVKDERKAFDGDPQMKGKRLQMYMQLVMEQIQSGTRRADVVVTNPTHFSVAIAYDADSMRAPRVVAKGADLMAFRVREVARSYKVPIIEKPPLARALYWGVAVGQEISAEHYEAVAEILAFVYRTDGSAKQRLEESKEMAGAGAA